MDTDEEGRYSLEEAEREWEREALESQRRSRNPSFLNTAGTFFRTLSVSGDYGSLCDQVCDVDSTISRVAPTHSDVYPWQ